MKLFEIRKNGTPVAAGTRRALDAIGALYAQPRVHGGIAYAGQPVLDEIGDTTRVRHWQDGRDAMDLHAVRFEQSSDAMNVEFNALERARERALVARYGAHRDQGDASDWARWECDVDGYAQLRGLR